MIELLMLKEAVFSCGIENGWTPEECNRKFREILLIRAGASQKDAEEMSKEKI
jgi:hypothetical protein